MKHEEEELQMSCVRWFGYRYPRYAMLLHHSPNGGFRNPREAGRFKAMGTRAGFPDLVLLVPRGVWHGLFIEMKSNAGKQTALQKEYQLMVETEGYRYEVARSFDEFMKIVGDYLSGE